MGRVIRLEPQPGPQTVAMSSPADVLIFGGAAGPGKSWMLLAEPLRHIKHPGFGCVTFRRTSPQITNEGSLWDKAQKMYLPAGLTPNKTDLKFTLKTSDAENGETSQSIRFSHMEYEADKYSWDSTEICLAQFDELQQFTKTQFSYILSRNRSTCGVKPYVRASCNPLPGSWILELIDWYIDKEGNPIRDRSGVLRYFVNVSEVFVTAATAEELIERFPGVCNATNKRPLSFTFVHGDLTDNKILMDADPGYMSRLMALPLHEQARLIGGNWKHRKQGKLFKWEYFKHCTPDQVPSQWKMTCAIDPSGGDKKANDAQGIACVGLGSDGKFYVWDAFGVKLPPLGWARVGVNVYHQRQAGYIVGEDNFGGDMVRSNIQTVDPNVSYERVRASRNKTIRAEPIASLYAQGKVIHVGIHEEAEAEMVGYDPVTMTTDGKSPNILDALVMAIAFMMDNVDTAGLDYVRQAASRLPQEKQDDAAKRISEFKERMAKLRAERQPK